MTVLSKKTYFFFAVFFILLGPLGCSWAPVQRGPSSTQHHTSFNKSLGPEVTTILIWNTYKGKRSQFENDARQLVAAHDIILFQEVVFNHLYRTLMKDQGRLSLEESVSWGANGVASAASSTSLDTLPVKTKVREFGIFTPKASLFTTYKIQTSQGDEKELLVLNVHMINFRTSWGFEKNLEQYRQKLRAHDGPVLAAGDFNTWSQVRHDLVLEFFREFGLKEVPFDRNGLEDPREKNLFGVLDRAFTRGLDIHWSLVHEDIKSSDHRPFALGITAQP